MSHNAMAGALIQLLQVVDGLFVGCAGADRFPSRTASDREIIAQSDIVVAAVDSTYWLLSGPDTVVDRAHARLVRVSDEDVATVTLSAWGR
jgi:hypothetical protein